MSDFAITNPHAERAVLGAALLGSQLIDDAADILQARDFDSPTYGDLWDICTTLRRERRAVDPQSVAGKVSPRTLHQLGGVVALVELASPEVTPNPGAMVRYAEQVLDAALRRRIIAASMKIRDVVSTREDASQAAEDARQIIDEAASQARTVDVGVTIGAAVDEALVWLEESPVGADTPWPDVNFATNGLLAGQMITVAARPGHGKSLVAKDVALYTAQQGKAVHIATLEMTRNEYLARIYAGIGKVDLGRMLRRQLGDSEWEKVGRAANAVRDLPIRLEDQKPQTMAQIRAGARRTRQRLGPLGLIAIDYAQLITPSDTRMPREQQVAEISRQTKLLAGEFECPVLLLAQLNRGNTQRADHTPIPSDLRESGSLEQDSDQVWLLHRPDQYPTPGDDGTKTIPRAGEVDLIVGKNRNGPAPTTIPLMFQGHYGRISSAAHPDRPGRL